MCGEEFCDGNCDTKECVGTGGKKCKGVKKGVVKKDISFEDYQKCLFTKEEQQRSMNTFRSRKHDIQGV